MRDGIFKAMPQSREWRSLWRSCDREADRGEITRRKAERALQTDLKKEMTGAFTRRFVERCAETETMLPTISGFGDIASARELGGENSPLEEGAVRHVRRLETNGLRGATLGIEAIACALADWADSQQRQMAQHCINEAGEVAQPVIAASREALRAQDFHALARAHLESEGKSPAAKIAPVNLDDDLSQRK